MDKLQPLLSFYENVKGAAQRSKDESGNFHRPAVEEPSLINMYIFYLEIQYICICTHIYIYIHTFESCKIYIYFNNNSMFVFHVQSQINYTHIYIYYLFFFGLVSMSAQCCAKPVSKAVYDDMHERGYAFVAFIQWSVSFF